MSGLEPSLFGIVGVAQEVAEQIDRDGGNEDPQRGAECHPFRFEQIVTAIADHHAPGRRGRLDTEAEEA